MAQVQMLDSLPQVLPGAAKHHRASPIDSQCSTCLLSMFSPISASILFHSCWHSSASLASAACRMYSYTVVSGIRLFPFQAQMTCGRNNCSSLPHRFVEAVWSSIVHRDAGSRPIAVLQVAGQIPEHATYNRILSTPPRLTTVDLLTTSPTIQVIDPAPSPIPSSPVTHCPLPIAYCPLSAPRFPLQALLLLPLTIPAPVRLHTKLRLLPHGAGHPCVQQDSSLTASFITISLSPRSPFACIQARKNEERPNLHLLTR